MAEDKSVFFEQEDDFDNVVVATYTELAYVHPSANTIDINGEAGFEYDEFGERAINKPVFECAESEFSNLKKGDKLTHGGVDYQIVEWTPDGTGLISLRLAKV